MTRNRYSGDNQNEETPPNREPEHRPARRWLWGLLLVLIAVSTALLIRPLLTTREPTPIGFKDPIPENIPGGQVEEDTTLPPKIYRTLSALNRLETAAKTGRWAEAEYEAQRAYTSWQAARENRARVDDDVASRFEFTWNRLEQAINNRDRTAVDQVASELRALLANPDGG